MILQTMVIVWGFFGLFHWIEDGGVMNKAVLDDRDTLNFTEQRGMMLHGIGGMVLVPLVVLAFLIVSFFAKIPGGVAAAGIVVGLVVAQVALGIFAHGVPGLGILHALGAFLIIGAANAADRRAKRVSAPVEVAAR
ncbi:hypothetical protein [Paractinoplanes ferrugineus]|uniref:hypothetical protein n=1 Tax=Paractinoplanes ferrugineus TaxID=113564 RepID=UPI001941AEE1|nr:hypothetical protein [Actinoplanes ferrugineus]